MRENTTVVDDRRDSSMGTGMVLGIVAALLVVVLAVFLIAGGPGRFMSASPSQTNVNVPAGNAPAQPAAPAGPQINIPPKIDLNVNQQPQAPQAPAVQAPADAAR